MAPTERRVSRARRAGATGADGATGATGPQGATGAVGPQGAQGPQGDKGDKGDSVLPANWGTGGFASAGRDTDCTPATGRPTARRVGVGTPARGPMLPITQNQALFALLGTTYGGDGWATFALPDLSNSAPYGMTYTICMEGVFPSRD